MATFTELVFGPDDNKAVLADDNRPGSAIVTGTTSTPTGGRFGSADAAMTLEAYAGKHGKAIDWVMAGLDLIGDTASEATWYLETTQGDRLPRDRAEAKKGERLAPSDLVSLMERPNPWMSYEELIKLTLIDELLTGDAFWLLFGQNDSQQPLAIYRLSPALVEIIPGKDTMIKSFKYSVPGMTPVEFSSEDVLQFKRPNPHDPYRGAGIIAGGRRAFEMELALTDTKANYYEQGAKLSGVLETERSGLGEGVLAKIRKQFMGYYQGTSNAYKVAVLEAGMKFNPISSNAAEAEFGAMSDQSRDRILAMLRVPPALLGLSAGSSSGTSAIKGGAEDDRRTFANSTVRPRLNKLQNDISIITERGWGLRFKIDYEYQMPIETQLELATNFAALPGVKVEEVRSKVGLDPLGDERDQIVLNLPGENDNESKVKDRNLGTEPGRPPKGEHTAAIPAPGKTLPADAKVREAP